MIEKLFVFVPLIFVGCATAAPKLNCDQACAMQGMVCTGQTISQSDGSFFTPDNSFKTLGTNTSYQGSSNSFVCAKDPTKEKEIAATRESIELSRVEKTYTENCIGVRASFHGDDAKAVCDRLAARIEQKKNSKK